MIDGSENVSLVLRKKWLHEIKLHSFKSQEIATEYFHVMTNGKTGHY